MSESPNIHNVDMQNFQQLVLENSIKQPVLVDFWADWCEPCKTLMPILTKLAEDYAGKFVLAKVNADEQQELAAHFGVKSLPTMKLFVNGQMVDERSGVIPESEIRAFIDAHITCESDQLMAAAMAAIDQGNNEQALEIMNQALGADPENATVKVQVAQLVFSQGDLESALALLGSIKGDDAKLDSAIKLKAKINMAALLADLPKFDDVEKRLKKDPNDLHALKQMSHHLSAQGEFQQAMECLLQIMQINRSFEDDGARKGLLEIFDMLGNEHPDVQKYRRKLFTLLH